MFEHSIKVPRHFKIAANIVKKVSEEGGSIKTLLYDNKLKHFRTSVLYALINETIKHAADIEKIFKNSSVLSNEPRLDPWLAKVLTAELLFGKKTLPGKSKPEQTILSYKETFEKYRTDIPDEHNTKVVYRPRYVRINTNLLTTSDAIRAFQDEGYKFIRCTSGSYNDYLQQVQSLTEYDFTQDYHVKTMFVFFPGTKLHEHDLYLENKIILQDKATALPVHLLAPPPGSIILDMCAAPGMKTTQLAAYLRNEGKIYAVERNENRYETLCNYVEATGSKCVETLHKDSLGIRKGDLDDVQYILLDPSCSGSGMELSVHNYVDDTRLAKLTSLQEKFLKHAMNSFPNAKRIVYSTCSLFPEENERVITNIVKASRAKWRVQDVKELLKGQWNNFGSGMYGSIGTRCLYARSESDFTTGFFLAVLDRDFRENEKSECNENKLSNCDKEFIHTFEDKSNNSFGSTIKANLNNTTKIEVHTNQKDDKLERNNFLHNNEESLNMADVLPDKITEPSVKRNINNKQINDIYIKEHEFFDKNKEIEGTNYEKKNKKNKQKNKSDNIKIPEACDLIEIDDILEIHKKKKKIHKTVKENDKDSTISEEIEICKYEYKNYDKSKTGSTEEKSMVMINNKNIQEKPKSENLVTADENKMIEDYVILKKSKKNKLKTHDKYNNELKKNDTLDILHEELISIESSISADTIPKTKKVKRKKNYYEDISTSEKEQLVQDNLGGKVESKKEKKKNKSPKKTIEKCELFSDPKDTSMKHDEFAENTKKEHLYLEQRVVTSELETICKKKKNKLEKSRDQKPTEYYQLLENQSKYDRTDQESERNSQFNLQTKRQEDHNELHDQSNAENPVVPSEMKHIKKKKRSKSNEHFEVGRLESNYNLSAENTDSSRSPKKKKKK